MNALLTLFFILGFTCFAIGLLTLAYYPLSLAFELRRPKKPVFENETPLVSIVVPGYNEEKVIGHCVDSILASDYPRKEIILVDDGSTDGTLQAMQRYEKEPGVVVMGKPNGGKASALNAGLARATGEVLFFVDADGVFARNTISEMLKGFDSERVGAVCGNDSPVNLDRLQTRLANLQTHVGTGFVRRALAMINCLPIVSGNIGAFRRNVLDKTGPFLEGFIGEDLELTWRVHKAGYRVAFQPWATVYAEVPSTIQGLWKQRVRWARGLLQTARIHRDMFFNLKYGVFGLYLPLNFFSMVIIPLLQLASAILLPVLILVGRSPIQLNTLSLVGWLGLGLALFASVFSIVLNRAWGDLKYLYVVPLWIPYSLLMDAVALWALCLELRGTEARWNKLERTGVVSRKGVQS
jgi:cellulose synthase/poly-beta-1,6-N-acetylglucosamine synthase-like glycosyltransferase